MKSVNIDNLKQVELSLFQAFIGTCQELNLKYYLIGGTLLGAVRHKGFIPWDDDIDVGMPRSDYELFISNAQAKLPDYYFIQNYQTDPEVLFAFTKLRDSRTTFIETSMKNRNINHGIYIDIFPLDYYPEDRAAQRRFDLRKRLLTIRIRKEFTLSQENKHNIIFEKAAEVLGNTLSVCFKDAHNTIVQLDRLYKSIPYSNLVANYAGAWGKKEIVPQDWYNCGIEGTFEGLKVNLPVGFDRWLTQVYGNYMELPPEEKRKPHHYVEVIDLDKSYITYKRG